MKFSVWPSNQQPLGEILELARHAEATGWDGVWMADHLLPAMGPLDVPVAECWTSMTAIIASVPRIRVGSLVLSNTFRHPAVLSKMAATLDSIAAGRFVLGLGAGWQENEHEIYGIDLPPNGPRLRKLEETCRIIRDVAGPGVRLMLGVKGEQSIGIAARWGDEWNSWTTPDVFTDRLAILERHCAAAGRDPVAIYRSTQAIVSYAPRDSKLAERWGAGGRALCFGTPAEMQEQLGGYAAAGVDEFIVPDFALGRGNERLDAFDRFLTEVAASFR
jgi:alkanesulfonate monooxygenase SsuD/methylene tetrahydromethanopterin reductase-like flavin-dependent oxidoreductase (luciferase family)